LNPTDAIDGLYLFLDDIEAESIGWIPLWPGAVVLLLD
jgi:hypothetical protein